MGAESTGASVPGPHPETSPGVRSPLGDPLHLPAVLVPSRRRCRGSRCLSPMPSCSGSHVPRSAAVPAPPRLAPHPIVLQPAGGRGGLWADARATPNPPKQMPPICHSLRDAAGQPNCAPAGQRVKRGGAEGDRPGWAEATCLAGRVFRVAQVLQGLLGAGVVPVAAQRWTFILA